MLQRSLFVSKNNFLVLCMRAYRHWPELQCSHIMRSFSLNSRCFLAPWCFVKKQKMHKSKIALNFYTAVKNTKSQKRKHIVAIETATVTLTPQLSDPNIKDGRLIAGKTIDLIASFPEHNSIVPIPLLVATGWFHGGVEIRAISKNSMTVRLLNGTDKDSGGYSSFKLLFFE